MASIRSQSLAAPGHLRSLYRACFPAGRPDLAGRAIRLRCEFQTRRAVDNFLPVKEPAGRPADLEVLRQFGLMDSERTDLFLNSAFASRDSTTEPPNPTLGKGQGNQAPKTPYSEQSNRNQ